MSIIDLRQLGCISADEEIYLANLITKVCDQDKIKHQLSLYAKEDLLFKEEERFDV